IEDMEAGRANNLPILMNVDEEGRFKKEVELWVGKFVKDADPGIVADLKKRKLLYKEEMYEHEYPFCWRCDTPLIYYAKTSWFVKMTALRDQLIVNNEQINWVPNHLKHGRFGEWLKDVKDWNLSRERYWGTPLPIWECVKCQDVKVIASAKEIKKKIRDLHRPFVDRVIFECAKCGGEMKRVAAVADCWFDSGSMPYAQWHYPFENKEKIDNSEAFPADFISEAIDQTRGWFYTLLAVSTLLDRGPAYKNVICLGHVLDAKGQKMSKSRGNIVEPMEMINQYGADTVRWYLYTVNQAGDPKRFDAKDLKDKYNRFFGTLYNTLIFFTTYAEKSFKPSQIFNPKDELDKWVLSRLHTLISGVTESLENYEVVDAARAVEVFVEELSNWYVRRSRRRFQKPEKISEKKEATQTLHLVLLTLAKLIAPFIPFLSEEIYLSLKKAKMPESVHLCDWPAADKERIDQKLEEKMVKVREIIALALAERAANGLKVRQPLRELKIKERALVNEKDLLALIQDEVNVRTVVFDETLKGRIELDKKITKELKEEGAARDWVRSLQDMRKAAGLTRQDKIVIAWSSQEPAMKKMMVRWEEYFKKESLAKEIEVLKKQTKYLQEAEIKSDEGRIKLAIRK
ncbi:MAG: class I tRNA ligase family protein, partial [Patescibacteria group bacterium]